MKLDRRRALSVLALAAAPAAALAAPAQASFLHGVASGDPLADGLLIWTRATPSDPSAALAVRWEVAEDAGFARLAASGVFATGPDRDHTVKVEVQGLKPATNYHYRFRSGGTVSPVGRARTLPVGRLDELVLAVVTCSLHPNGYFNAYDHISKLEKLDAVVELGDYIYEFGAGDDDYGMANGRRLGRVPEPAHEILSLQDYRARHAQYKRDPDLQAAHARCAWICVWDDHEVSNDDWVGGAQNHQPRSEGPWLAREAAALKAYYEWMPIREPRPGRAFEAINRSFQFGDLASLIMVESRLVARSYQLEYARPGDVPMAVYDSADPASRKRVADPARAQQAMAAARAGQPLPDGMVIGPDPEALAAILANPERQMLGARQEQWLAGEIAASVAAGRPWQVLGNQVVMARTRAPDMLKAAGPAAVQHAIAALPEKLRKSLADLVGLYSFDIPYDLDGWDGYPAARERVYDAVKAAPGNAIVVCGDSHAFWANELHDDAGTLVAAEFGTSSITSPTDGDYAPGLDIGRAFMDQNREVVFCDQNAHGYIVLTLRPQEAVAEMVAVEILARPYKAATLARFRLTPTQGVGPSRLQKL